MLAWIACLRSLRTSGRSESGLRYAAAVDFAGELEAAGVSSDVGTSSTSDVAGVFRGVLRRGQHCLSAFTRRSVPARVRRMSREPGMRGECLRRLALPVLADLT